MNIRRFLIGVFLVFCLSFSSLPVSIPIREKDGIVYVVNFNTDDFSEFIKNNKSKSLSILVSLALLCMLEKNYVSSAFNTS